MRHVYIPSPNGASVPERMKRAEEFAESIPDLWRVCYPRIYRDVPGNFYSTKLVSTQLFETTLKILNGFREPAELYEFQICNHIASFKVPTFYISPGLMEAMMNTAPPAELAWMKMRMPFEAAIFMVPKGTIRHEQEGDVVFMAYARFQKDCDHQSPLIPGHSYGVTNGGMLLVAQTEQGLFHHWNMPEDDLKRILTIQDIADFSDVMNYHPSTGFAAEAVTPEDNKLYVHVAHYIFTTLLIMTERPEMVTTAVLEKRVCNRNESPKEFWSPNIVGANYKVKTEGATMGEHASPRLHFVRGFWRMQSHGVRHTLRRHMWIEPFMRGQ